MPKYQSIIAILIGLILSSCGAQEDSLVIYSSRQEHLIKPITDTFTKETGIPVTLLTGKTGPLIARLQTEGKNSPADILFTVDAGNLWHAAEEGLLQAVSSQTLDDNIPAHLKDPENRWFGFSIRARTIAYNPNLVSPDALSTYEDLTDPKWKNKVLLRTSKKVYNQSLTAMLIHEHGPDKTKAIIEGWVRNLATPVFSSDTAVLKAIAAGQGHVGIVNSYYFGRLKNQDPNAKIALFWPNQDSSGVHINISGAGQCRYSPHPKAARQFLEWLSGDTAQRLLADSNMEYPVNPRIAPSPEIQSWGPFKASTFPISQAGQLQKEAIQLMDAAGYE